MSEPLSPAAEEFRRAEIAWPADPAKLPRDECGRIVAGRFVVDRCFDGTWRYGLPDGPFFCGFESEHDALNEGALRDDYR